MLNLFVRATTAIERLRDGHNSLRGVTMLEYVLMALLVVAVGALLWGVFGSQIAGFFETIISKITGQVR